MITKEIIEKALIRKCYEMVARKNVCPKTPRSEMLEIILYCHDKGFLYTNPLANAFVCCYKVPKIEDKNDKVLPDEEKGEILYVNFAVSENPSKTVLLKMLRGYLMNNPEVKEVFYYRRGSDTDTNHIYLRKNNEK